jgi:hypothetical protein
MVLFELEYWYSIGLLYFGSTLLVLQRLQLNVVFSPYFSHTNRGIKTFDRGLTVPTPRLLTAWSMNALLSIWANRGHGAEIVVTTKKSVQYTGPVHSSRDTARRARSSAS